MTVNVDRLKFCTETHIGAEPESSSKKVLYHSERERERLNQKINAKESSSKRVLYGLYHSKRERERLNHKIKTKN